MADLTSAVWGKSSRSGNSGNCVEVARNLVDSQGLVFVRDSKNTDGPTLAFSPSAWSGFLDGVRDGQFDLA